MDGLDHITSHGWARTYHGDDGGYRPRVFGGYWKSGDTCERIVLPGPPSCLNDLGTKGQSARETATFARFAGTQQHE